MINGRRGPRGLGPEDRALWEEIKKTIRPLRSERRTGVPAADEEERETAPRAGAPKTRPRQPSQLQPSRPVASKAPPPLTRLDRRTRSRVARGLVEIDARIDLHGLTLERARARLANFLASAHAGGAGLVLVITGKGGGADWSESGRGVLRREVPHWLSSPTFRSLVIGFEEAAPSHGGAGALYVRLRRRRN